MQDSNLYKINRKAAAMEEIMYVVDEDSGWETDEGIVWHIDESNAAEWAEGVLWASEPASEALSANQWNTDGRAARNCPSSLQ
jgi:hypothetical protein